MEIHVDYERRDKSEGESIAEDVEFEINLIKQQEINVDYISMMIGTYR